MGMIDKIKGFRRVDDIRKAREAAYAEEERRSQKQYNWDQKEAIREDRLRTSRTRDTAKAEEEAYEEEERRETSFSDRIKGFRRARDKDEAEEAAYREEEKRNQKQYNKDRKEAIKEGKLRDSRARDRDEAEEMAYEEADNRRAHPDYYTGKTLGNMYKNFSRVKDKEKAEDEAYEEADKREMSFAQRIKNLRRVNDKDEAQEQAYRENDKREAKGKGSGMFVPRIELTSKTHPFFWTLLPIALLLFASWYFDFFKEALLWISFFLFFAFIAYGFVTGVRDKDNTKIWVAFALLIWFCDLFPTDKLPLLGPILEKVGFGQPFTGFEFPGIHGILSIPLLPFFTSGVFFILLYIDMVRNIINRKYLSFMLIFSGIIISNLLFAKVYPEYLKFAVNIPSFSFMPLIFILLLGLGFYLAYKADKKFGLSAAASEIPDMFTRLFMIFIFCFFWVNNGWMGSTKAIIHAVYIFSFGFMYMAKKEQNARTWQILMPLLLIFDFFGVGFLWNSGYLWAKYIPILVLFVVPYCYYKSEDSYALVTFIFVVTLILILSLQSVGLAQATDGEFTFTKNSETTAGFTNLFDSLFTKTSSLIKGGIRTATGGYSDAYFGNVENNQYEPLGVYFDRLRVAQPKFYNDEPVTIWGTIKSRSLSDPANVNFNCSRWDGTKRIPTGPSDILYPNFPFTVYTSEEKDVECTFNQNADNKLPIGSSKITLSAQYNFETNAYQKIYFMDKDRYRSMMRENLDPLGEFGIKDKTPIAIYTNGPVKIATDTQYLMTVTSEEDVKPSFGIALENRNQITDKNGNPVGKWEGKIKKIRELILLLPNGVSVSSKDGQYECGPSPVKFKLFTNNECAASCDDNVGIPCQQASCRGNAKGTQDCEECINSAVKCKKDCESLFTDDAGKIAYTGYQLDTDSINKIAEDSPNSYKDIDRFKTFRCRLQISSDVLDNSPVTTKYFRIKARYNYYLDKSFEVSVEQAPGVAEDYTPYEDVSIPSEKMPVAAEQPVGFPSNTDIDTYFKSKKSTALEGYGQCIKDTEAKTGVPALVILGIANHESDKSGGQWSDMSDLSEVTYNLFGMKCRTDYINSRCTFSDKKLCCKGWDKSKLDITYEPTAPNAYKSFQNYCEAIEEFGYFVSTGTRYKTAMSYRNNPEEMVRQMRLAGYATDPNWAYGVIGRMAKIRNDLGMPAGTPLGILANPVSTATKIGSTTPGVAVSDIYFGKLNSNQRNGVAVDTIVLHHTADSSASQTFNGLQSRGLSVHYIIDRDGTIYYAIDEALNAWHAGNWNSRSIGIEIVNTGKPDMEFTDAQYSSISSLIQDIASRWSSIKIDNDHVKGHFQVSNDGKVDPSPNFDWSRVGLSGHPTGSWQ